MKPELSGSELARLGFGKIGPTRKLLDTYPELSDQIRVLGRTPDPDLALMQLTRLIEDGGNIIQLQNDLGSDLWNRLLFLLGGSRTLGDYFLSRSSSTTGSFENKSTRENELEEVSSDPRLEMLLSVGADPASVRPVAALPSTHPIEETDTGTLDVTNLVDSMRIRYRELLMDIAAEDLASENPLGNVHLVGARLARLADAAIESALAIARLAHDPQAKVTLAVIALGKTGARELNYISDVDIMFLAENDASQTDLDIAATLAKSLSGYCSAPGNEPPLWTLDAGLRPEGRDGALVRTVSSTLDYYRRWAQNWEFQAMMKARASAGAADLAEEFITEVEPLVWSAASRPGFVSSAQQMRVQVEDSVRSADKGRELKLSPGGLRDVEFTVQLLQLVHGQTDPSVRVANTLEAIDALAVRGYVGRGHALELSDSYRFLRLVEHRVQLQGMRRTHTLPSSKEALRAIGRSIDTQLYPSEESFEKHLKQLRRRVRELHEDVYYRPIVAATARLGDDQVTIGNEAAEERLRTIGYGDPAGALRCIAALTAGTSRRAMIQRNLSSVIIQWLAEGADPDMGILSFRTLSDQIGSSHWYLSLLRDSRSAAWRLCQVLSNSRWAEGALSTIPEAITWLDTNRLLEPLPKAQLEDEASALIARHDDTESAMNRVSSIVTREVTRAGLSDCVKGVEAWHPSTASAVDVAAKSALTLSLRERSKQVGFAEVKMIIVGMGRFGGRENSYASDLDVLFVHQAMPGIDEAAASAAATVIANRTHELLQSHRQEAMVSTDLDLRPEGRQGAISRTIQSYREYYNRWASTWERHALVRARQVGGNEDLGNDFFSLVNSLRWNWDMSAADIRDIRLLKARMENERLPRGIKPTTHVKLGPGGLSDVEWTVQLLQLKYAGAFPDLRVESTLPALQALVRSEILAEEEGEDLKRAWDLASRIRSANVLASARLQADKVDTLPRQPLQGRPVANLLGYGTDGEAELVDQWLYASRRARIVMEKYFWE